VTGTGGEALFVGPNFTISVPLCVMTSLEVLDENGNKPHANLTISMKDGIVKPSKPLLEHEYHFKLRATISGGDFIITT
jgi:hypothetical protein